jgi:hypothetical protein
MSNFNELKELRIERSHLMAFDTRQDVIDFLMAYVAGRLWLSFHHTFVDGLPANIVMATVPCGLRFLSVVDLQALLRFLVFPCQYVTWKPATKKALFA